MTTAVLETLEVQLSFEDGQFVTRVSRANRELARLGTTANSSASSLQRLANSVDGIAARMRHFIVTMSLVRGAIHNVWAGVGQWQASIIKTNAEIERTIALMKALSSETSTEGRQEEATKNFEYMLQLAQRVPFSIGAIQDAFVKLKTAGIDPTNGSLESLLNAVAAAGGTEQQLHRAAVAIQQMGAKGVISMEELRQQLAEAVPQAFKMLAQAMGVSTQELTKRIAMGSVEASGALALLFKEFERVFGSAGALRMQTWDGLVAKFTTRWMMFQKAIGDSGYFENVKSKLAEIIEALDPAAVAEFANALGRALSKTIDLLWALGKAIGENWQLIKHGLETIGVFYLAYKLKLIAGLTIIVPLMWKFVASQYAVLQNFIVMGPAAKAMAINMTLLEVVTAALTRGFKALWVVLSANIWGILINGAIALSAWFMTASSEADELKDKIDALANGLVNLGTEAQRIAATKALVAQADAVDKLTDHVRMLKLVQSGERDKGYLFSDASKEMGTDLKKAETALAESLTRMETMRENHRKSELMMENAAADKAIGEMMKKLGEMELSVRTQYAVANQRAQEAHNQKKVTDDAYMAERVASLDAMKASLIGIYSAEREAMVKLRDSGIEMTDPLRYQATVRAIETLDEKIKKVGSEKIESGSVLDTIMGKDGVQKIGKLDNFLNKIRAETVAFKEEMEGGVFSAQKFIELARKGSFDTNRGPRLSQDEGRIQALALEIKSWDAAKKAAQEYREEIKNHEDAVKNLEQWEAKLQGELASINEQMDEGALQKQTSGMRALEKAIAGMVEKMDPDKVDEFMKRMEKLRAAQSDIDGNNLVLDWQRKVMEQGKELATTDQARLEATIELERTLLMARMAQLNLTDQMSDKIKDLFDRWAAGAAKIAEKQTPLGQMFERWKDTATQTSQVWVGAFEGMADALTNFVMTGKLEFGDLVRSIIAGLIKIQMQSMITDIFAQFMGGASSGGSGKVNMANAVPYAKGGIHSMWGSMPLERYANGGIAHKPQLAMFGEGTKPEAYVPLPDGRTIPVSIQGGLQTPGANVEVNVINQSGQQVEAESKGPRFDGQKMILDVVLKAAGRPGGFRDGLRGAVRGG